MSITDKMVGIKTKYYVSGDVLLKVKTFPPKLKRSDWKFFDSELDARYYQDRVYGTYGGEWIAAKKWYRGVVAKRKLKKRHLRLKRTQ